MPNRIHAIINFNNSASSAQYYLTEEKGYYDVLNYRSLADVK